jgi:transcriptional regulator with XRE-family HTH domain
MSESFGDLFKNIRNKKFYSQVYVAQKMGVSQSYISQIEKGDRKPTLDFIEKAWKELGFELIIIDADQEKELLLKIINKLKPFNIRKVVNYAQRFYGEENE